jgi:hypothetical protein
MKKLLLTIYFICSFTLLNGMGADTQTNNITIYCQDYPVQMGSTSLEILEKVSNAFSSGKDNSQEKFNLDIPAELFDFIIDCYQGIQDLPIKEQSLALEERLSAMDDNQLKPFMDVAVKLSIPSLSTALGEIAIKRSQVSREQSRDQKKQTKKQVKSSSTTKKTAKSKRKPKKTSSGGSQMELLEFKGANEADITKMVAELMLEALPEGEGVACLDDLSAAAAQAEVESWDRLTPAKSLEKMVNIMLRPDDRRRLTRIFRLILRENETPLFIDNNDTKRVIPKESLRELDVLVGSGTSDDHKGHSLAKNINHTQLHIGYATLMRHLAQVKKAPNLKALTDTLSKMNATVCPGTQHCPRTQGVHSLPLGKEIQALLAQLAPIEDTFLSFWSPEEGWQDPLWELCIKRLTARRPKAELKIQEIQAFKDDPSFEKFREAFPFVATTEIDALNYSTKYMEMRQLAKFGMMPAGALLSLGTGILLTAMAPGVGTGIALGATGVGNAASTPGLIDNWQQQLMALWLMQKKLYGVAKFVKTMKHMQRMLKAHRFPQKLIDQLELSISDPELAQLEDLLNKKAFKTEERSFQHYGKILVTYRLMGKKRNEFIRAYMGLGSLDMLASLRKLLDSSKSEKPYCLAQFGATKNGIQAKACWSPLLEGQKVITNDVSLGGQNPSTHIYTGPNARGKTTAMRSLGGAALLGSTLGIGSAARLTIPPNLEFITSVNIGDDPYNQLSLFQSLVRRMAQVMTTLEQRRKEGRPCLLIADEPFVGTDSTVSEVCASTFIEEVAHMNALALFSSHLKVSHLAEQHRHLIANYHLNNYHLLHGIDTDREKYLDIAVGEIATAFGSPDHPFVKRIKAGLKAKMHADSGPTSLNTTQTDDAERSIKTSMPRCSIPDGKTPTQRNVFAGTALSGIKSSIADSTAAVADATASVSEATASISNATDRIKRSADIFEEVRRIKKDKLQEWQGAIQEWIEHGHIQKEQFPSLITDYFRFAAAFSLNREETTQAIAGLQRLLALPITDQSDSDSDDESERDNHDRLQGLVRSRMNESRRQTENSEEREFLRRQAHETRETANRLRLTESSDEE